MAKKRKARKRVAGSPARQKPQSQVAATASQSPTTNAPAALPQNMPTAAASGGSAVSARDLPDARWGYVASDLRRIAILLAGCIIIQLVLLYFFNHSGLGPAIYRLVKL